MKILISLLSLISVPMAVFANDGSQFCAPQAAAAAQALANTNGSVSEHVESSASQNGKTYSVVLSEHGIGRDTYTVWTSGRHDCVVYSVKVKGQPTLRP